MSPDKIEILNELKSNLSEKLKGNFKEIVLFGSQLKEKGTTDSDFDILILLKNKANWKLEREISDICYDIDIKYGIITDTHVLSEAELAMPRGKQPIFVNALNNGFRA